jgi:DNA-binding transcriptional ArsR family regulator
MRTEHLTDDGQPRWEATAFINEADLLTRMALSPHVVRLYDCGYISSVDEDPRSGQIDSYELNVDQFRQGAYRFAAQRWRPYLALEILPRTENLLYLMKPNAPGTRWRLPTEEGLDLATQFVGLLTQTGTRLLERPDSAHYRLEQFAPARKRRANVGPADRHRCPQHVCRHPVSDLYGSLTTKRLARAAASRTGRS